jgi:hypothetical protein
MESEKENQRRKQIKKYIKQLSPIVSRQSDENKSVVKMLIDRISYLAAYLDELQEDTVVNGVVVPYNNGGGQSGLRVHPSVNVYVAYTKQFTATVKQLQSFLIFEQKEEKDELQMFIEESKLRRMEQNK